MRKLRHRLSEMVAAGAGETLRIGDITIPSDCLKSDSDFQSWFNQALADSQERFIRLREEAQQLLIKELANSDLLGETRIRWKQQKGKAADLLSKLDKKGPDVSIKKLLLKTQRNIQQLLKLFHNRECVKIILEVSENGPKEVIYNKTEILSRWSRWRHSIRQRILSVLAESR